MQQKLRSALQRFPRLKKCTIFKEEHDSFTLTLSWPDGEGDKTRTAIQRFSAERPLGCAQLLPSNVVLQSPSPTNKRVASLIAEDTEGDKKKFRVEVWDCIKGQIASVQVEEIHGAFLASEGLSWHDSEEMFAYVAEKKPSVSSSTSSSLTSSSGGAITIDQTTVHAGTSSAAAASPAAVGEVFQYREDWGEQYEGVVQPSIVLFDINLSKAIPAVSSTSSQFQPVFSPVTSSSPPGLFALAYCSVEHEPFKLGLIYCAQRPSEIRMAVFQRSTGTPGAELALKHDTAVSQPKSPGSGIAKSPRFSSDGKKLVFLTSPMFETHQGALQISTVDINPHTLQVSSPPRVIVDIHKLGGSGTETKTAFPDLYLESFPSQCVHKNHIYLTTIHGCRRKILQVNLIDGALQWIGELSDDAKSEAESKGSGKRRKLATSMDKDIHSRAVLGVSTETGRLLTLQTSPTNPGFLYWLKPDEPQATMAPSSTIVFDLGAQVRQQISTEILLHSSSSEKSEKGRDNTFQSILIYPSTALGRLSDSSEQADLNKGKLPLILYPHGGPHSAFTTDYSGEMAFICEELKVGILMVNYRGSIGPDHVETLNGLPGNCGTQDVSDCMLALKDVLSKYGQVFDEKRVAVIGGSHGGFLTAHLSGQYPDTFKCAVLRNPVIDIAAMSTVTDIPDWCYVEAMGLGSFDFKGFSNFPPTPKEYTAMFNQSPIRYVDSVKLPTLIAIGDKDRRVPPSQGLLYYRALKIRGVDVSLMKFPKDSHPIDRAASNEVQWTTAIEFLKKHLAI